MDISIYAINYAVPSIFDPFLLIYPQLTDLSSSGWKFFSMFEWLFLAGRFTVATGFERGLALQRLITAADGTVATASCRGLRKHGEA